MAIKGCKKFEKCITFIGPMLKCNISNITFLGPNILQAFWVRYFFEHLLRSSMGPFLGHP